MRFIKLRREDFRELSRTECLMQAAQGLRFMRRSTFSDRETQYIYSRREHKFMIYGDKGIHERAFADLRDEARLRFRETPVHGL